MRRISVRVKPSSKKPAVTDLGAGNFLVAVGAPAREGKANDSLRQALAEHFGVPPSSVRIASGHGSRRKIVEIG